MGTITVNLKSFMEARGDSMGQLSRATDISYSAIFNLLHGKTQSVSFDILAKLCEHYSVTPGDLLSFQK